MSEKVVSVMTLDYLKSEAAQGIRSNFDQFMNAIPNAPATQGDELPKI